MKQEKVKKISYEAQVGCKSIFDYSSEKKDTHLEVTK